MAPGTNDILMNVVDKNAAQSLALKIRNWVTPIGDHDDILALQRTGIGLTYSNNPNFSRTYITMNSDYLWNELAILNPSGTTVQVRFYHLAKLVAVAPPNTLPNWDGGIDAARAVIPGTTFNPADTIADLLRPILDRGAQALRMGPSYRTLDVFGRLGMSEGNHEPGMGLLVGLLAADRDMARQFVENPEGQMQALESQFNLNLAESEWKVLLERINNDIELKNQLME